MYPSRLHLGDGQQVAFPEELGQLQPYAVHIPPSGATSHPHGLLLSIHSNGQHYWQYDGTGIMTELGDARDAVVLSPLGRGHDGWYVDSSEDDVFESWADVARHVKLDPTKVAISGYSMGGYATYRLGGLYPDLFGKAFSVVGPPGKKIWVPPAPPTDGIQTLSNLWLENTRNVPYLNFNQVTDELVPLPGPVAQNLGNPALGIKGFDQLGYRFRFLLFEGGEHYTLAALGYHFPIAKAFLGDAQVDRDPAHVTFAYVPGSDNKAYGLIHDHAYWVSALRLADVSAGPGAKGVVDVRSHGFGRADPISTPEQTAGVQGLPYVEKGRTWSAAAPEPVANRADVTVSNLRTATLQLDRARLTVARPLTLDVTADRASNLVLAGPSPTALRARRDGQPTPLSRTSGAVTLPLTAGRHIYVLSALSSKGPAPIAPAHQLPSTGGSAPLAFAGLLLLVLGLSARVTRSR
jgi:pimeloyl-ACP methyl ester carboxylesterase